VTGNARGLATFIVSVVGHVVVVAVDIADIVGDVETSGAPASERSVNVPL
jgi:hypothetical protein